MKATTGRTVTTLQREKDKKRAATPEGMAKLAEYRKAAEERLKKAAAR